ncbi:hypothetical protein PVAND_012762 [Polypedilum vanderplanki]|uniref:Uncharacterized protein n=1 Tax=Polypedilum vanderplanki TaxID=319348 RepID=A0A9J6CNE3_POLVA|nr:hypothetical protein PVAND_012762 [Polypedilum vanderplanki]
MEHGARLIKRNSIGQRSPSNSIYESHAKSPSPSSQSQKSTLSRQGTVRASHRRKNSASHSLNLSGRRSPLIAPDRSPSGRRSPNYLSHDLQPFQITDDRKSPTRSPTGKRSPLGFSQSFNLPIVAPDRLRSSPSKEAAIQCWNERMKSPTSSIHLLDRKSPVSFTGPNTGGFYLEPRRSPINQLPIPPITISNPSETCGLSPKSIDSGRISPRMGLPSPIKGEQSPIKEKTETKETEKSDKPEKKSVMREILAFVRKPSKKVSTRTSRFAAAFSKSSNNDSNAPLVRQSTFSNMPNSSSRAGRTAVTKQMSYEPKISSKLKSVGSKMSLKLRRATEIKKEKKSSGDEVSDVENSERFYDEISDLESSGLYCEFENVYFEKVGQGHKKPEQIVEEEDSQEKVNEGASTSKNGGLDKPRNLYEELKRSIETLFENKEHHYENIDCYRRDKSKSIDTEDEIIIPKTTIQCPTFEIEPPSRRASFDPPRSPFLENFRSLSDTDHDIPSGESFEVVDTNHRESSFEDRYSSMDTSFDISRYHSTSYEDQTSSFEIVESHLSDSQTPQPQNSNTPALPVVKEDILKTSNINLSKSSIEIVDPETFQKSSSQASGRKSSLETHFDLSENYQVRSAFASTGKSTNECFPIGMKATHQASLLLQQPSHHRTKSPILSNQTSSNYSSRDSYESSSTYDPIPQSRSHSFQMGESKNPFSDITKHHYPMPRKYSNDRTFLCIDKRCASIFEPRSQQSPRTSITSATCNMNQQQLLNTTDTSSGSEFEAPSPRRALSASPKHTFTFRIVMKKVESSPEDLCVANNAERHSIRQTRERERQRRDSRRRKSRLSEGKGKSF